MIGADERRLIELWLRAGEGAADEAQIAQLSELIRTDEAARACILQVARQQGWLAWNASNIELPHALNELTRSTPAGVEPTSRASSTARPQSFASGRSRGLGLALAACLVGILIGHQFSPTIPESAKSDARQLPFEATMVSSTGCIWGPGNATGALASRDISSGDALQLLEGLAEFRLASDVGDVQLQMEGPAAIVLTANGAASMSYGKIIVNVGPTRGPYVVETSFGRVLLGPRAEVGLISFGSNAEVHCFRGSAAVESPWLRTSDEDLTARVELNSAEALRFKDIGGAMLQPERGAAEESRFTPQVSMATDFLSVTPDYVHAIVNAAPVAYWRFEQATGGVIPNEMGGGHQGRIKGEVGWAGPEGNRAVELGLNPVPGSIVSSDSWDDVLQGDFSIELWMKPNHHHLGSMVGFVGEFDASERRNKHGVLLETCGPASPYDWLRVNQIRFLHRAQLTANAAHGVSCFTTEPYESRRWQYVVAVREGNRLLLYVDGALAQMASDDSTTPSGLQLVIGQLYTETVERFFIGQLDEVAIYDRALQPEEVAQHFELLRPADRQTPSPAPVNANVL